MTCAVSGWGITHTDVSIIKTAPATVNTNAPLAYTLTVRNVDNSKAAGTVRVVDTLPSGVTYINASGTNWTCSVAGQTVTCDLSGTLSPLTTAGVVTINATAPSAAGTITNTATVSMTNTSATGYEDDDTANDASSVSTTVQAPAITVSFSTTTNSANEGNSGTTNIPYTVTLSASSTSTVTVPYTIAGTGTNAASSADFAATSGTLSFSPGVTSQTLNVAVQGETTYEPNETFTVTLSTPLNASLGTPSSATGTITNDDSIPALSVSNVSKAEGSGGTYTNMVFTGTLSNPSSTTATVTYSTYGGTATQGTDYTGLSSLVLTFNPGETTKTFYVPIWGDIVPESDENFTVGFTSPSGLTLPSSPYTVTGTIVNDDADAPHFTIADQAINEANAGTTNMIFTVSVTNMKTYDVNVSYATANGTAVAGSDYVATSGTLTFTPGGSTTQTITVPIVGDTTVELMEQFYVLLSNPTGGAVIDDDNATGTINDNDTSPTCSPYIGQMTINEYNFIPGVKDEFGNQVPGTGDFVELKVIGQTLRNAILNDPHFLDNWKIEVHNNAGGIADGWKFLPDKDPLCDFVATGYLIYTFGSAVLKEGPITIVVKDDQNRVVDILYYGNNASLYTPPSCTFVYDTNMTESTSQNKDVFRLPDGTGEWNDNGVGANSGATRCTNPGGGFEGIRTIFDAFDYKTPVTSADIGRPITTKVSNKPIELTAISTNSTHTQLQNSVKVASWLARKSGSDYYLVMPLAQLEFSNASVRNIPAFTRINAGTDHVIAFKYCDNGTTYRDWDECWPQGITAQQRVAISWDNFAIRPDRFNITSANAHMPGLLRSGEDYNTTIHAYQYGVTADTPDYNVTNAQNAWTILTTKYNRNNVDVTATMAGTTTFAATGFDMADGVSAYGGIVGEVAGLNFNDVGKINIALRDQAWAAVDINNINDTTPRDCSATGAYICGDTNMTFIPYRFMVSSSRIVDSRDGNFTYYSNDLNMSAKFDFNITSQNKQGGTTLNFDTALWENPITAVPSVFDDIRGDANESNITNSTVGFGSGVKHIMWNDGNNSMVLKFNFARDPLVYLNPTEVNTSEANLSVFSTYTDGANTATPENNATNKVGSNHGMTGNAIFLYGRTDAPNFRFPNRDPDNLITHGCGRIYFEFYSTLPNNPLVLGVFGGVMPPLSLTSDRFWYQNTLHDTATDGNVTGIATPPVTVYGFGVNHNNTCIGAMFGPGFEKRVFEYDAEIAHGGFGYPFKSTSLLDATDWLDVTGNNFGVEFYKPGKWIGVESETTTATDPDAETVTNRRILW